MVRNRRPSGPARADQPPSRPVTPPGRDTGTSTARRQEALLDEAIEETFPASDPISPMVIR